MTSEGTSLKSLVREKYARIAEEAAPQSPCCGPTCGCGSPDTGNFSESYAGLAGYAGEADLGLGCGLPTNEASIKPGDVVLDLGCGAGNDVFVAQAITGPSGYVIGLDMTEAMIDKANRNKAIRGVENVEFRLGEIESMPVDPESIDVVISNCVLNLVPDKLRAFREIHRVLKPGGRFSISDVVVSAPLPEELQSAAALYTGCVAGAIPLEEYLEIIRTAGFVKPELKKSRIIELPDELLLPYLSPERIAQFRATGSRILSVTIAASKQPARGDRS